MERIGVGLLGLGTVGTGVYKALRNNQDVLLRRTGQLFEVRKILVRDPYKTRQVEGVQFLITTDFHEVLQSGVQVVIEVIGGLESAYAYVRDALTAGCHVVTANKELIAKRGKELEALARQKGVQLLYEAAVGGGIPVLGSIGYLLKANRVHRITGILNGTTNYILTEMEQKGLAFDEVLRESQEKGYAEADPSSDVDGHDAKYKLAILARLAFEAEISLEDIPCRGIRGVTSQDITLARRLGYAIKLLAQAEQYGEKGPISLRVGPALLPENHPLAGVNGVHNAVTLEGDWVQDVTLVGQGAGEQPTASAVVEDVGNVLRLPRISGSTVEHPPVLSGAEEGGSRFVVVETEALPGLAGAASLRDKLEQINLEVEQIGTASFGSSTVLGLVLCHWNASYTNILLAELGIEVKRLEHYPVIGVRKKDRVKEAVVTG
ncbi:hypothetical protein GCM10011571_22940 [Marinithermofilum abyssi]|uniref:Homoserine dehydrogenase n=1 Tax=Marinithermofilum abyssi TaxID=1571185 RepID=A0A8J2VFH4_9BACL|nr:homoserine dehydrogenase [Marinithermofilum abyssi]GGE20392.1 hypothetical protein GCM10011571_22940 [Marinithermofilum abyssi]